MAEPMEPKLIVVSDKTISMLASMIVKDMNSLSFTATDRTYGHSDALFVIKEWLEDQGSPYDQQRRRRLPDGTWGPWEADKPHPDGCEDWPYCIAKHTSPPTRPGPDRQVSSGHSLASWPDAMP